MPWFYFFPQFYPKASIDVRSYVEGEPPKAKPTREDVERGILEELAEVRERHAEDTFIAQLMIEGWL